MGKLPNGRKSAEEMTEERRLKKQAQKRGRGKKFGGNEPTLFQRLLDDRRKEEEIAREEKIHKAGKRFVSFWMKSARLDGHCEIQVFNSPEFESGLEQLKEILFLDALAPKAMEFCLLEHGGRLALVKATSNVLVAVE